MESPLQIICPFCNSTIGVKDLCKNGGCPSRKFTIGNLVYVYQAESYGIGMITSVHADSRDFGLKMVYPKYTVNFKRYNTDDFYAKELRHYTFNKEAKVRYVECEKRDLETILNNREKNKSGIRFGIIDEVIYDEISQLMKYRVIGETGAKILLYEFEILDVVPETITSFGSSLSGIQNFFLSLWANQIKAQYSSTHLKMVNNSRLFLLPHQVTVAYRLLMKYQPRMILADEVGLGKTIEAGLFMSEMMSRQLMKKILIIVPANLQNQWQFELKNKFHIESFMITSKNFKEIAVDPSQNKIIHQYTHKTLDYIIISLQYARLKKPKELLCRINWDLVIFDEAHHLRRYLQNSAKQVYRKTLAYSLAEILSVKSKSFLLLTATPVQLDSFDLYSLIELLYPREFPSFQDFELARANLKELSYLINSLPRYHALSQFEKEKYPNLLQRYFPAINEQNFPRIMEDPNQIADLIEELKQRNFLAKYIIRNRRKIAFPDYKVKRVPKNVSITLTERERNLYNALRSYVVRVYSYSLQNKTNAGIGFLLAIFLKLVTSSLVAINKSFKSRIFLIEKFERVLLKLKILSHIEDEDELLDRPDLASLLEDLEERRLFTKFVNPKTNKKDKQLEDLSDLELEILVEANERMEMGDLDDVNEPYFEMDIPFDEDFDEDDDVQENLPIMNERERNRRRRADIPEFLSEGFDLATEIENLQTILNNEGITGLNHYLTKKREKLLKYPRIQKIILSAFVKELETVPIDSKLAKLKEIVEEIFRSDPNEKVIIFIQFKETLYYVKNNLLRMGFRVNEFHGDLDLNQKNQSVNEFKEQGQILLSTEIGGEGRNFQFCHIIINYDLPWNPMKLEQRIGRLDRIGQTKDVIIYNFFIEDSIEAQILEAISNRIILFEESVGALEPILEKVENNITNLVLADRNEYELRQEAAQLVRQRTNEIDAMKLELRNFVLDERIFRIKTIREHIQELNLFTPEDLFLFTIGALKFLDKKNTITGSKNASNGIINIEITKDVQGLLLLEDQSFKGTFDLELAKQREELDFFALGHPLVNSLANEFASFKFRGRTARFSFKIDDSVLSSKIKNPQEKIELQNIIQKAIPLYLFVYELSYSAVITEKSIIPIVLSSDGVYLKEFSAIFTHPAEYFSMLTSASNLQKTNADNKDYEQKIRELQKKTSDILKKILKIRSKEMQSLNEQYYKIEREKIEKAVQYNIQYANKQIDICNLKLEIKAKQLPTDRQIASMEGLTEPDKKEKRQAKFKKAQEEYDAILAEIEHWRNYINQQQFDLPEKLKRLELFNKIKKEIDIIQIADYTIYSQGE